MDLKKINHHYHNNIKIINKHMSKIICYKIFQNHKQLHILIKLKCKIKSKLNKYKSLVMKNRYMNLNHHKLNCRTRELFLLRVKLEKRIKLVLRE